MPEDILKSLGKSAIEAEKSEKTLSYLCSVRNKDINLKKYKTMKTNDKNNFAKRTAGEVRGILSQFNLDLTPENQSDGNLFMVYDNSIKTRVAIKKAGFLLDRCLAGEKNCYFRCHE